MEEERLRKRLSSESPFSKETQLSRPVRMELMKFEVNSKFKNSTPVA
jgi:hypothetical protein